MGQKDHTSTGAALFKPQTTQSTIEAISMREIGECEGIYFAIN